MYNWLLQFYDNSNNNNNLIQKAQFEIFYNLLTAPRTISNMYAQVARVQITCNLSSACHVQHVVVRATLYEGTTELLSLTEFK